MILLAAGFAGGSGVDAVGWLLSRSGGPAFTDVAVLNVATMLGGLQDGLHNDASVLYRICSIWGKEALSEDSVLVVLVVVR